MNINTKDKKSNDNTVFCRDNDILKDLLVRFEPMVHHYANKSCQNAVCNEEDLCQEGRMAIMIAYDSYDDNQGTSLATWICNQIKWAMLEYQKKNFSHLTGGQYLYNLMKQAGENATIEDLMGLGASHKTALASTYYNLAPAAYGEQFNMADRNAERQLEAVEGNELNYSKYLTEKESFVLEHYFGLNDRDKLTMEEIGEHIGTSRKAVSYAINKSVVKLRHVNGIEDYCFDC